MKRRLLAVLIGVLMVGSMSTAAYALASDDGGAAAHHGKSHGHQAAKADQAQDDEESESADGNESETADGPPPWAHGHAGKPNDAWKQAWRALTPAERAAKMAELAQKHADGMKKFSACVKHAGADAGARAKCVRPLPPGQAKKQLSN